MRKHRGRYRPESQRLRDWDYDEPAWYFVTICTHGRRPYFGQVIGGEVDLSAGGKIVAEEWLKTPKIRTHVALDEFVIMPNHLHGILVIEHKALAPPKTKTPPGTEKTPRRGVSTNALAAWKPGSPGAIMPNRNPFGQFMNCPYATRTPPAFRGGCVVLS
jgi:hypothetical protein